MMEQNEKRLQPIHLTIGADPEIISFFLPLLNKGFEICATMGVTIQAFLCDQIGLSPDYLENRIQTLFADGKAVDDFGDTLIRSGSVLALSGAMPGLAGATLRRGGFYGRMRGEISHDENPAVNVCGEGQVRIKLFNLILKEAGPLFLKHGVIIDGEDFYHRLLRAPARFETGCRSAELDGKPVDPALLSTMDWDGKTVFLRVY
jgi:hypothetical protein